MVATLIFKCTEGAGVGIIAVGGGGLVLGLDARWQPITHSARSGRSYGKIEDCEQSSLVTLTRTRSEFPGTGFHAVLNKLVCVKKDVRLLG